ncbi:hypothetical protein HDU83_002815 [Entophlyctis luteolus]|nr:hypothetical protein HDU83_002815 [Entophlyctis luteolus]KAJ3385864.1 hypothetical protein HDU84_001993 [Entophlyctis sp. JEL0112]
MSSIACCAGTIDEGDPTGAVETVAGHSAYIATPPPGAPAAHAAVIMATDVFGYTLNNTRLMADRFAAQGYLCIVPDLFKGTEVPSDLMDSISLLNMSTSTIFEKAYAVLRLLYYFPPFILRNSPKAGCQIIESVVTDIKANRGLSKVALVGYCWGGNIGIQLAKQQGLFDVIFSAHPGGAKIPQDIDEIKTPIYFALAEVDMQIKAKEVELIKESLSKNTGLASEVEYFEGVEHGFAIRGSVKDGHVNAQKDKAFDHAVAFFKRILG